MGLSGKTQQKFEQFFAKMAHMFDGREFEIAYSEIRESTGSASDTMKRVLQTMVADGVLEIRPGRNSRYGRFRYLNYRFREPAPSTGELNTPESKTPTTASTPGQNQLSSESDLSKEVEELAHLTKQLLRSIRSQEMAIALLQDRVAELEDKMFKR